MSCTFRKCEARRNQKCSLQLCQAHCQEDPRSCTVAAHRVGKSVGNSGAFSDSENPEDSNSAVSDSDTDEPAQRGRKSPEEDSELERKLAELGLTPKTCVQLRAELKKRNLPSDGLKVDLLTRLLQDEQARSKPKPGPKTKPAKRIALVWGNSYAGEKDPLSKSVPDAQAIKAVLERKEVGFEVHYAVNLNYVQMIESLHQFSALVSAGDVVLFYFSGHGIAFDGVQFLVPENLPSYNQKTLSRLAVSMLDVTHDLVQASGENGVKLFILDACRSRDMEQVQAGVPKGMSKPHGFAQIAAMPAFSNKCIFYATAESTFAFEGKGKLSVFTEAFVRQVLKKGQELAALQRNINQDLHGSGQNPNCDVSMRIEFYFVE